MNNIRRGLITIGVLIAVGGGLLASEAAVAFSIAQVPLFLTQPVDPRVMLVLSRDEQLYTKAYSDYSDLDGDGVIDTTYKDTIDYYGYFDSDKCYTYDSSNNVFEPAQAATGTHHHSCSDEWSGNFLNWATMTRMDVLRKVLYGGYRSTDTTTDTTTSTPGQTILERALLPSDLHAFAKVYSRSDISDYVPSTYISAGAVTLCNVTNDTNTLSTPFSKDVTSPPLVRVAPGAWPQWASADQVECASSGSFAPPTLTIKDFTARVEVCKTGLLESDCEKYPSGDEKPIGLLQTYSEGQTATPLRFGLITGSFQKNTSGGMLRRNIERLEGNTAASGIPNEIDAQTGQFINQSDNSEGIIKTIDRLRISSYDYGTGVYDGNSNNCSAAGDPSFTNGQCVDWGNPIGEMFLEMLRYYAGQTTPTSAFTADDSSFINGGLPTPSWTDPDLSSDSTKPPEWCAPDEAVVISSGVNSFDTDELGSSGISGLDVTAETNTVGTLEGINGGDYFIGGTTSSSDNLCTAKPLTNLADALGVCPAGPNMAGGYQIAGMAYYAANNDMRPDLTKPFGYQVNVTTHTVDLAQNRPRLQIPVGNQTITLLPACEANADATATLSTTTGWWVCGLADMKVDSLQYNSSQQLVAGRVQVTWGDSTWGHNHDMDGIEQLDFCLGSYCTSGSVADGEVQVTVSTPQTQSYDANALRFGFIISGSTADGVHWPLLLPGASSGGTVIIGGTGGTTGTGTWAPQPSSSVSATYTTGTSSGQFLQSPLWYAAKYGTPPGTNWDANGDGVPDHYSQIANPANLYSALNNTLGTIASTSGSVAAVASDSTSYSAGTLLYQASFNSKDWSGDMVAYSLEPNGVVGSTQWDAASKLDSQGYTNRNLFTWNPAQTAGVPFSWSQLSTTQQGELNNDQTILNYIAGDRSQEQQNGSGSFRNRSTILGDIINSDPVYSYDEDFGYSQLPTTLPNGTTTNEGPLYTTFLSSQLTANNPANVPMIYVGANDGMLHAFDAQTGAEQFAYIPNAVLAKLPDLTASTYDSNHQYFVDGSLSVVDAYFARGSATASWHKVLIGSLGAGGNAIYALDVTNPASFGSDDVLWEISSADSGFADLGAAIGQPTVAQINTGQWVALFGSGYGANGQAALFVVNLADGSLIKEIPVGTAGGNGLASPVPVDIDNNRIADIVYAGDLKGRLWRFDLSNADPTKWSALVLFTATYSSGTSSTPQPITVRPTVGFAPSGGQIVYFGTGKYFEQSDVSNKDVQSFYAVWDNNCGNGSGCNNNNTNFTRSNLLQQSITDQVSQAGQVYRATSGYPIDWKSVKGWYIDLLPAGGTAQGERVISPARLNQGRILFTTLIPPQNPCDYKGESWLMVLDALSGAHTTTPTFDLNGDNAYNSSDEITAQTIGGTTTTGSSGGGGGGGGGNGNGSSGGSSGSGSGGTPVTATLPPSGIAFNHLLRLPANTVQDPAQQYLPLAGANGSSPPVVERISNHAPVGRQSWRQLQ